MLVPHERLEELERRLKERERDLRVLRAQMGRLESELQMIRAEADHMSAQASRTVEPAQDAAVPEPLLTPLPPELPPPIELPPPLPKEMVPDPEPATEVPQTATAVPVQGQAPEPGMDLETRIGVVWLNRLGLVAILIGIGLFARYFHRQLQPWHKTAAGYAMSLGFFLGGWFLDRKHRIFARPVMAGGLAIAFFTSFAAHFVKPMECLSLTASLTLMSASTLGIFACAERWRSEPTAGFAIVLGHVAVYVAGGAADSFSLVAVLFLSCASVALFARHDWAPLNLFAVASAYVSHFLWAIQEHAPSTPETRFWVNFGFFTSYHAAFLASELLHASRAARNPERYARLQSLAARAVGPLSLIFYSIFAAGIFRITGLYWDRIHFWLFPLAGLEIGLLLLHRRWATREAPFHALAAATFATLGLFSAFHGLTLNLALAAEALLILVLALRSGLWYLHPIAQAALAINFVHYWLSETRALRTGPAFAGGCATAIVYLIMARLEETWRRPVDGTTPPGSIHRITKAVRQFFEALLGPMACVHAVLAGILLTHVATGYFHAPNDLACVAVFTVLVVGAATWLESGALCFGIAALAGGAVHVLLEQGAFGGSQLWTVNHASISAMSVAAVWALKRSDGWPSRTGACASFISILGFAAAAGIGAPRGEPNALLFPLWLAAPVALWAAARIWHRGFGWVFGCLAAVLTAHVALHTFETPAGALWLLLTATAVVHAFASQDKGPPRLLAGAVLQSCLCVIGLGSFAENPSLRGAWVLATNLAGAPLWLAAELLSMALLRKRGSLALAGVVSLLAGAVGLAGLASLGTVIFTPLWAWLCVAAAFWFAVEPLRIGFRPGKADLEGWRDLFGVATLRDLSPLICMLGSMGGAAFLLFVTTKNFAWEQPGFIAGAETAYALVFLAAAVILRSPGLAAAQGISLGAAFAIYGIFLFEPRGRLAAVEHPWLTSFLTVAALLTGAVADWLARRRWKDWDESTRGWATAGALYGWILGLLLGTWAVQAWLEAASYPLRRLSVAASASFAFAGFLACYRGGLGRGERVSHTFVLLVAMSFGVEASLFPEGARWAVVSSAAIAALFVAMERCLAMRVDPERSAAAREADRWLRWISVLGAAGILLLGIAQAPELEGSWTTLGWSVAAFGFTGLGFLLKDKTYRRTGLGVFGATLVRVLLVDVARLETFYRMLAFLSLGASLLVLSFLYTKFRDEIRKWI